MFSSRPPIQFFPIVPEPMVSGAEYAGNESTERGRAATISEINFLHAALKVFGDDEFIPYTTYAWPGIELLTPQDEFDFVRYIGEEEGAIDWGSLSVVDLDFDGTIDADRAMEDGIPYDLYREMTGTAPRVDYDQIWEEARSGLSSDKSFWQDLEDGTCPESDEGSFAFLVGLNQTRRSLIYGMTSIGIDPFDPSSVEDFEEFVSSWRFIEGGGINNQILLNYIGLLPSRSRDEETVFDGVAGRLARIAEHSWITDSALEAAGRYYSGRVSGIGLDPLESRRTRVSDNLTNLLAMLNDRNRIVLSEAEDPETATEANAMLVAQVESYTSRIRSALSGIRSNLERIHSEFGLVRGRMNTAKTEFEALIDECLAAIPGEVGERTNFSAMVDSLTGFDEAFESLITSYQLIKDDPAALIDGLFAEFSIPLSDEYPEEIREAVRTNFFSALERPMQHLMAQQCYNGATRSINRRSKLEHARREDEKQQQEQLEKKMIKKNETKRMAEQKAMQKKAETRVQQRKQAEGIHQRRKQAKPKAKPKQKK